MTEWKNGTVKVDDMEMDYIAFGSGEQNLIIIPGLGDGLRTVKGTAATFSMMYRRLGTQFRVYVFSRRNEIEPEHSSHDMAADIYRAACFLGIKRAHVLGISQGGMIVQWLAVDYPELTDHLILVVTADKLDAEHKAVIESWMDMASEGDYSSLMVDTVEKMYSEKRLARYRKFYPLLISQGKPKSFQRFLIMAQACLDHDTSGVLHKIACPTLIIGGNEDRVVGTDAALRLAEKIPESRLHIYEELGHGAYEEAKDFQQRVLKFLADQED